MAVQHYQTSQEAAECLQQCSCNSKHSRVLIALLHWEEVVGIKDRKRDTKKKKSDAKQSICDKWQLKDLLDCLQIFSWIIKLDWDTKKILKFCDQQSTSHKLSACFPAPHHPPLKKKKKQRKLPCLVPWCAPNVMPLEAVKWGATHEWLCCWERRTYRPSLSGATTA